MTNLIRLAALSTTFAAIAAAPPPPPPPPPAWNCGPPLTGWKNARTKEQTVVNTIVLSPGSQGMSGPAGISWNGSALTIDQVREYVTLSKQLLPVPTLVLVVTYGANCREVAEYRHLIDETLDCEASGVCVEVTP